MGGGRRQGTEGEKRGGRSIFSILSILKEICQLDYNKNMTEKEVYKQTVRQAEKVCSLPQTKKADAVLRAPAPALGCPLLKSEAG